jgi:hypothetical protein
VSGKPIWHSLIRVNGLQALVAIVSIDFTLLNGVTDNAETKNCKNNGNKACLICGLAPDFGDIRTFSVLVIDVI